MKNVLLAQFHFESAYSYQIKQFAHHSITNKNIIKANFIKLNINMIIRCVYFILGIV